MNKSPNKIVIIGNGNDWKKDKIISFCQEADFIIAADNGLSILHQFNVTPDLIIGDLDSVSSDLLKHYSHIPIEVFPRKKDFSDLELCIKRAITMNPKEIILLAVTGNYFDHSYASVINLFRYFKSEIKMKIVTSNSLIFPINGKIILSGFKGRRFSLFPINSIKNLTMRGVQYQFPKENIEITDYSLGNVVVGKELEINLEKGMLFCILFDDGWK